MNDYTDGEQCLSARVGPNPDDTDDFTCTESQRSAVIVEELLPFLRIQVCYFTNSFSI